MTPQLDLPQPSIAATTSGTPHTNVTITDPVFKAANCKGVTGRCIQRQNVDAITSQGLELEAGARLGARGLKRAATFDWRDTARMTLQVYRKTQEGDE